MGDRTLPWASHPGPPADENSASARLVVAHGITASPIASGLVAGSLVALLTVGLQACVDDQREDKADRRENVRFVRQLAADGKADVASFRDMDLAGGNLSGLDLTGADFTGADLAKADLTGTVLSATTLDEVNLSGATLRETRLSGASLREADLSEASLVDVYVGLFNADVHGGIRTDFTGADLTRASLLNVTMFDVDLSHADFRGAVLGDGTRLDERTVFNETAFHGADLVRADLPWYWEHPLLPPDDHFFFRNAGTVENPLCFDETTRWPARGDARTVDDGQCPPAPIEEFPAWIP